MDKIEKEVMLYIQYSPTNRFYRNQNYYISLIEKYGHSMVDVRIMKLSSR